MMGLTTRFNDFLAFLAKNERKLGALLFAFGFLTDLFTFTLLPLAYINLFFATYLALVAVCAFGANLIARFNASDAWWRKTLAVLFPLGVQYALGGLLSGFLVFYASHSVIAVSWPFLALLLIVYVANEYFRKQREHLIFQTILFFVALYAYTIFALPFFLGSIGPWVFMGSTALALFGFAIFLRLLYRANKERTLENVTPSAKIAGAITGVMVLAYFTGAIPPLPLALSDSGVYHAIAREGVGYRVLGEAPKPWYDLRPQTLHVIPGASLYAYSAVVAPASFGSTIVHRWERNAGGKWVTENKVAFPISGGREGGYRGYSLKSNVSEGEWRITVETASEQAIGRFSFTVEEADREPTLIEEVK